MNSAEIDKRNNERLRQLPSVHRLLSSQAVTALDGSVPQAILTESARCILEQARSALVLEEQPLTPSDETELAQRVVHEALRRMRPSLQRAINATGIVLHTGLGRARLANAAREAIVEAASAHSLVEIDRDSGKRGSRQDHVRGLLRVLTGAQDAAVVNNCAGAVFLAVTTLAAGRDVLISRGELVEIGGAFRMPDIIRASGAALVEVGTTNRTRLSDYADAITDRTGLILRCHPSNFAIVGFTEVTPTTELVRLGNERGIPVMDDQGSGAMISPRRLGLPVSKGSLAESVAAGSDIVTASGDKLLGGPQAGLILGKGAAIERIIKHPLARALRIDKLSLAGLEATLRLYREPERAMTEIPTLRYLNRTLPELKGMAQRLKSRLQAVVDARFSLSLLPEQSQVGGGSLPGENLPTICVALSSRTGVPSVNAIAAALRQHEPPIFGRIKSDMLLFDPRSLERDEFSAIAHGLQTLMEPELPTL